MKIKLFSLCALCFLLFAGTLFGEENASKRRVVTTFTLPADWIRQIAGDRVEVVSLVPANADNHAYQPSPSDIRKIKNADFVFAISPQFEKWFDEISKNERQKNPKKFVFLGDTFFKGAAIVCDCGHHHHHTHAHAHAESDPHFWTDPSLVAEHCIPAIEQALNVDGAHYRKALKEFEAETEKALAVLPPERRKIVTYHNNMTHFARRFGFEIASTLLNSSSTEAADPSAKTLAKLTEKIRRNRLPIFVDNTVSARLPNAVAKSADVPAPAILRVDALDNSGTPADTYLGMMRENVRTLIEACSR